MNLKTFRRYIVIGDIHGCLTELKLLLGGISIESGRSLDPEQDALVLVGDIFDKGPYGPEVLSYLRGLEDRGWTIFIVMGNHEETNFRFFEAEDRLRSFVPPANKPEATPPKNPVKDTHGYYMANYEGTTPEDREWLWNKLRLSFVIPGTNYRVVHAGVTHSYVFPDKEFWKDMDRSERGQASIPLRLRFVRGVQETILTTTTKVMIKNGQATSIEEPQIKTVVREPGKMLPLGEETETDVYWAALYDGRFGHILFGHNAWGENGISMQFPHATGLDLGCVFGNSLCAAVITPNGQGLLGGDISFHSVQAEGVYCGDYRPTKLTEGGGFLPSE